MAKKIPRVATKTQNIQRTKFIRTEVNPHCHPKVRVAGNICDKTFIYVKPIGLGFLHHHHCCVTGENKSVSLKQVWETLRNSECRLFGFLIVHFLPFPFLAPTKPFPPVSTLSHLLFSSFPRQTAGQEVGKVWPRSISKSFLVRK